MDFIFIRTFFLVVQEVELFQHFYSSSFLLDFAIACAAKGAVR